MKLEYAKSEEQTERTAKVIVQYNDSLFEIKVTQACGRAFEFDENAEFIHTAKTFAGEKSFAFKSNVPSWEATSSDKWLSVDRTLGGKGDFVLTISYENSTSQEERSATITVKSKNSDSSFVITVNQWGGRVFEFNEGTEFSFEVGNTKGTKTFNFKSNVSAWSTASSGGWLTADPSSLLAPDGKGNHTLTLKYLKYC